MLPVCLACNPQTTLHAFVLQGRPWLAWPRDKKKKSEAFCMLLKLMPY
jgi:hypothetical protein